jgi:hypothetical protein
MDADQQPKCREFERVPTRISVELSLKYEGWEVKQSASIVDLSRGGLRIRTDPALDEGQVVYVYSEASVLPSRYYRVVWARAEGLGLPCEVGLEPLPQVAMHGQSRSA